MAFDAIWNNASRSSIALSKYHPDAALRSIADYAAVGVAFASHVTKAKSPRDIRDLVLHCSYPKVGV
jgi:hypothetical protein